MAKHAKKKERKIEVSVPKFIVGIIVLIVFGFCVGGLIAFVLTSGMPTRLLVV